MTTQELGPFDPARKAPAVSDTSFEHELDERPPPQEPVYVDKTDDGPERRPIIPLNLRTLAGIKSTARRKTKSGAYLATWHGVRVPFVYLPLTAMWSVVGVFRLVKGQLGWWWVSESEYLRQQAATNNEPDVWSKLTREVRAIRLYRGLVLAAELLAALIVYGLYDLIPAWVVAAAVAVAVPLLAKAGLPAGRHIIGTAVVASGYRRLNSDIVLRAYYVAGLGHPDKPNMQIEFLSQLARDHRDTGSQVRIAVPHGKTFADVVKAKDALASGIDVTEYQVFLTRDRDSIRRHTLFVADRNPLAIPAGRTPMLDCRQRDIWQPMLMGLDERSNKVLLQLLWNSILIGAQPRKGKTFTARLIALYAALDPWVKLFMADGKNSPDLRSFALVADRMVYGTTPTARDGDPVERLLDMLRHIKRHISRVNEILSRLPTSICPEGKLTRELARDPRYPELRIWMLLVEEFHLYFETEDQEVNKEVAQLMSDILSGGPSAGVIVISSSQKPSGVGAGDVSRLFNRFRDNHAVRFALKCGNDVVSRAVLGGDAYAEGYDASSLPIGDGSDGGPDYRGIGYLYGASDRTPTVRTHLADAKDAEKILLAARAHRERLGLLTGEAAGDVTIEGELVDPLADALAVIATIEANISWPRLAARLAEQMPDRYAGLTPDAISARIRGLGIKGKSVADEQYFPSGRGQGVARSAIESVAAKRAVSR